ncbi:hypothetical protein FH972_027253 [Carpinus fangiana]|uniref:Uncharacterized protein n=1 Tax=Carpinus fangiana TaxID=176857 RepID=A0A5N6L6M3_9ROSI|nr:hypothetical protein FH972_027253 [Carpinus fangiana]
MNCHSGTLFSAKDSGPKHEKLLEAIKTMNDIEQVLINIVKFEPQWCNLLKSIDTRVQFGMNDMVLYIFLYNLYIMSVSEYEMYIDYPEVDDEEGDYDIWWAIIMLAWE